ncbi:uncharacterized protein BO95DRAFT_442353 [Aspergillus brunneoviolaceus CBS 621.78]|uniref:Uncharacterized protein n=1 Tax=Aspergillus brunneoviolaceus CBS 621.78 TaxID=1450534 RepID=A0ACD1GAM7_9EURO|nr:hypothetical protein BO95DRAFT_442353 [Aspergillus brunneoviolaceus CBS 621.78]RAH46262.1 hypothetical protein BO95DRAFT_442353 [Aspergillus brunneoviolaceus CBS 621.78]
MATILRRLPMRAPLHNNGYLCSANATMMSRALAAFSTHSARCDKEAASQDTQSKEEEPKHWKYDFSFKTQMSKTAFIAGLALGGSLGGWSWYRDLRGWWTGIPNEGEV